MTLTQKARKAVAAGLALSTVMWSVSFLALPVAFAAAHNSGCLVNSNGTVYLISNGQRRGFTSEQVFVSHGYNFGQVVTANSDDNNLSVGSILVFADGTLVKGPNDPLVYLVVNGQKRGFTSGSVFTGLGYSFANIVWAPVNTFTDLPTGANIDSTTITGLPMSGPGPKTVTCSTTGSGNVSGGAGDITVTALSTYGDEEVGEGDDDVSVAAFEIEADDNSDVEVTSIKVELAQQTGADSEELSDYATEVSVWMGSTEVGRADVDEFNENNDDFTKSISLDGAVIEAGESEEFTLAISALSNLDSGDIDTDDWQIGVSNVRFVDGEGVTTTDALTLDIDDDTVDDTVEEEFDFASFATASNVELKVALNEDEDEINDAHVIDIDDTDDTDEVEVLAFTVEADGDSDLNIQEIPATFTTTGETDEAVLISNAQLWYNGESIASDTIPTGGAVVFEDLDVDVDAGEMAEFVITADIQDTTGAADNGDTVSASLTTTNADDIEADDESGEEIADGDASGSATGSAHAVYDAGIMVEFVSASTERSFTADATGEDDQGTFMVTFSVTAFDGDMRIDNSSEVADANAAGQGVEFSEVDTAGTPVLSSDILESDTTDTEDTANTFEVDENTTREFTLSVIYAADSTPTDGSVYVKIDSINWGTATDDTNANYYEFDLGDFKTDYLFLNGIA